jgi:hypothetical protein
MKDLLVEDLIIKAKTFACSQTQVEFLVWLLAINLEKLNEENKSLKQQLKTQKL